MGFGLFNIVEGIIDHHILQIHHVRQTVPEADWPMYDYGFLAILGVLPLVAGVLMTRKVAETDRVDRGEPARVA